MEQDPIGDWAPGLQKAKTYEQLLLDIILGLLPPGGLIDERKLAVRYGVGLAGVREALGRLALEGLVVRRPRVGTMVAALDLREIEQAFEVRHLLEARSAGLAARNARPGDVAVTGVAGRQTGRARLEQMTDLEGLFDLAQVEGRDHGPHPGPAHHQPLQRQAAQGLAHPGQAHAIAGGELALVDQPAGRQQAQDDVEQQLLVGLGLLQARRPVADRVLFHRP